MWSNSPRDSALVNSRDALHLYAARNIELPAAITDAAAELERIKAARPVQPEPKHLHDLILDGADTDTLAAAVVADLGHQKLHGAYQQAEITAALRVLRTFRDNYSALFAELKTRAREAIVRIQVVADLGDIALTELVRDGRHQDAQAVVELDTTVAELETLHQMHYYLINGGYLALTTPGPDCTHWRDPKTAAHHARGSDTTAQALVRGVRAGAGLWFPDASESVRASEKVAAADRADADNVAAIQRAQGFPVAVT
jgi:hypothetical protein